MFPRSLSFRLIAITVLWTVFALAGTGFLLSTLFYQNEERNFDQLLLAHAYNVMGAIDLNDHGELTGEPRLGDPLFLDPFSGWSWFVARSDRPGVPLLYSESMTGEKLTVVDEAQKPFDTLFRRTYAIKENNGAHVQRLDAQLYLGNSNVLYQVSVSGNRQWLEEHTAQFNQMLIIAFSLFGFGTFLATFFVIRFGLIPLKEVAQGLTDVRQGRADFLEGDFPSEIVPLTEELNSLIKTNGEVIQRARTQVGNLAHALKTPLAVVINEVRKPSKKTYERVNEQAEVMQAQIQTYLNRARIAAQKEGIATRTPVKPVLDKLLRVMKKLTPRVDFSIHYDDQAVVFKGEQQDLEEVVGNLLENASRFAKNKIQVKITHAPSNEKGRPYFKISILDDGQGLTKEQRALVVQRGKRLDETTPGSGLGLSIVHDIADEYDGHFELGQSPLGGLAAAVILPKIAGK